jgi:outer membrane usher protein
MKGQLRGSFIQRESDDPSQTLSYYGNDFDSGISYNLNQTKTGQNNTSSASVDWSHDYGSLGASVSSSSSNSSAQYSLTASGGLVLHRGGVLITPSLGDTFAILEVPNGKGVSVAGRNGRINSNGYGVVPNLSPYYMNDVQISLEGASTDLEVDTPLQKVAPVEGSISRLKFGTNSGRPLMIVFQTSTGVRVPIGATVTDSTGLEVGTVGQGSRALVRINKTKDQLSVTWGNAPDETCLVDFVLDAKNQANSNGYTNLKLPCAVGTAVDKTAQK